MRKSFFMGVLLSGSIAMTGCAQLGVTKQQAGTVIGGVAGALVGSQFGKGNGKILSTILVGTAGAYLGNRIGASLDEKDKQALALETQQSLNIAEATNSTNSVVWKSQHSGATAQIKQGTSYEKEKAVDVKRVASIQAVPSMKLIQAPYTSMKNANVRAAPSMGGDTIGSLKTGTEFTAVGSTGDWILVGRKGVTVGYVHNSLVVPTAQAIAKKVTPSVNLDEMNVTASADTKGFDLDSIPTTTAQVAATSTCRPVSISLKAADGTTQDDNSTYCKSSNGTWELI